jgi:hypothetical protein
MLAGQFLHVLDELYLVIDQASWLALGGSVLPGKAAGATLGKLEFFNSMLHGAPAALRA